MTWLWDRIKGAINSLSEKVILVLFLGASLLVWRSAQGDVTLPVWVFIFIIMVALLAGPFMMSRSQSLRGASPPERVSELESQNALYAYYATHVHDTLQTLQKMINGSMPGTSRRQLIEQGMLGPAREFLTQAPGEEIRISVLVPDGTDFVMAYAAGHRLHSQSVFRIPIAHSFSRYAFESGDFAWSDDVDADQRFQPHPKADRPYCSIISVPIRSGETVIGTMNVLSTLPYAFTLADYIFIALLGSLVDVAFAIDESGDTATDVRPREALSLHSEAQVADEGEAHNGEAD